MKRIALVLTTALTLAAAPVFAQTKAAAPVADKASAPVADKAADKAVRSLLDAMNYRTLLKDSFAQTMTSMPAMILNTASATISARTDLNPEQKKAALEAATKRVPEVAARVERVFADPTLVDELIEEVVPLYASRFTVAEIEQIAAFHRSPVGAKMLAAMPQIMSESMQISQKILNPRMIKIMQEATADK